jgi:hypothetical protein
MFEVFDERVIISGFEVEHYQYPDKPVLRWETNSELKKKKENKEIKDKKEQTEKSSSSVKRTRDGIRRIINCNLQLIKFFTLTFKDQTTDIKKANERFNLFTQRMKDRYKEFEYLSIPEFQKDTDYYGNPKPDGGAVHYHLLCNLRYAKSKELEKIWKNGFIKIKRIKEGSNLGAYVCKYLQKEMFDKRMFHKKKYFYSRELKKPVELIGDQAKEFMDYMKDNLILKKEFKMSNEYRGNVLYKIFNYKEFIK